MAITTKDIAILAGVSQSTVSRCLNDSPLISDETKRLVKKIAMDRGFEFNANARSLSTNKTDTIGIIYPDNFNDFSNNLYLSSLHNQLRDSLEKENLDLILSFAQNRYTGESNIKKLVLRKKVDGLIIVSNDIDQDTVNFLKQYKIPFVFMHHLSTNLNFKDIDVFGSDHVYGGYLAAKYLLDLGHRNIISISTRSEWFEFKQRTEGFKKGLAEQHIELPEENLFYGDATYRSAYDIVQKNLEHIKRADAIFAQNDIMAIGAIEALKLNNVDIPGDISVIGYDDIELGTYFRPTLTTIHQSREEIAKMACEQIVKLINTKETARRQQVYIRPRMVIRESCAPRIQQK